MIFLSPCMCERVYACRCLYVFFKLQAIRFLSCNLKKSGHPGQLLIPYYPGVSVANSSIPYLLSAGVNVTAVAAGGEHTCAVASSGGLWCWGGNDKGQLGIGSTAAQHSPVAVSLGAGGRANVLFKLQLKQHILDLTNVWVD